MTLKVARLRATGERRGAVFANPGGPGVSGVRSLPGMAGKFGGAVRESYDIELRAGYYEPGGASGGEVTSPAVNCLDLLDHRTSAQVMAAAGRNGLSGSRVAPGRLIISTSGNVCAASIEGMGALP